MSFLFVTALHKVYKVNADVLCPFKTTEQISIKFYIVILQLGVEFKFGLCWFNKALSLTNVISNLHFPTTVHKVTPINGLFSTQSCIRLFVSWMIFQAKWINENQSQEAVGCRKTCV